MAKYDPEDFQEWLDAKQSRKDALEPLENLSAKQWRTCAVFHENLCYEAKQELKNLLNDIKESLQDQCSCDSLDRCVNCGFIQDIECIQKLEKK